MVTTKMEQAVTWTEPAIDLLVTRMVTTKMDQTVTQTELQQICSVASGYY